MTTVTADGRVIFNYEGTMVIKECMLFLTQLLALGYSDWFHLSDKRMFLRDSMYLVWINLHSICNQNAAAQNKLQVSPLLLFR